MVWIHGGAWISGSKENVDPYAQILASHGYTTVALDYTVAPEATYPTALTQLNGALGYLVDNARDLNIDPDRIIIAGDSAGSNLTSQLAVLTTSPDYADLLGIQPSLDPDQLDAVILNCGIYDVSGIPDAPGLTGWGFRVALWSYIGAKDWLEQPGGQEMSTLDYVTGSFPTTWISGGNGDPLTKSQSMPLAEKLTGLGVDVETVFYPEDHEPSLPHEYQFKLDFVDAQSALDSTVAVPREGDVRLVPASDFDFVFGTWNVHNRRLRNPQRPRRDRVDRVRRSRRSLPRARRHRQRRPDVGGGTPRSAPSRASRCGCTARRRHLRSIWWSDTGELRRARRARRGPLHRRHWPFRDRAAHQRRGCAGAVRVDRRRRAVASVVLVGRRRDLHPQLDDGLQADDAIARFTASTEASMSAASVDQLLD